MIMVFDPQILFNDGFYPLVDVRIPEGTLLKPNYPAALSCRTHALGRIFDILGGLLGQRQPEFLCAAGFSSSPASDVLAATGRTASGSSSTRSASAASRAGRSATGRTGTRCGRRSPTCRTSSSRRTSRCASSRTRPCRTPAAPGFFRGGNGDRRRLPVPGARRRSRSTTTAGSPTPGASTAASRARARASGWSAPTAAGRCCRASATTSRSRPATCCTTSPGAAAAGATRTRATPSWSRSRSGAGWSAPTAPAATAWCWPRDGSVDAGATDEPAARAVRASAARREIFVRGPDIDELRERCLEETGPAGAAAAGVPAGQAGAFVGRLPGGRRGGGRLVTDLHAEYAAHGFAAGSGSARRRPCSSSTSRWPTWTRPRPSTPGSRTPSPRPPG